MRGVPAHVIQGLTAVPLFAGLSQRELRTVAGLGTAIGVKDGDVLTKEGSPGSEAFLIMSGKATCTRGGKRLRTLGAGDFVGEMSLLDGAPRSATVVAGSDMEVIVFNRREFVALIQTSPRVAMKLLTALAGRVRTLDEQVSLA